MDRRVIPIVFAAALLLAACGTSGGSDGSASGSGPGSGSGSTSRTTTTASAGSGPTSTTSSPTGSGSHAKATTAQLEKILPAATDVGPRYSLDPSSGSTSGNASTSPDPVFAQACPEAAALDIGGTGADNTDQAKASFSTDDDRSIEVALDPTPVGLQPKDMGKIIDAFNACKDIEITEQGTPMTMSMAAKELSGHGDGGMDLTMKLAFTVMNNPITIEFHGYIFSVDGVGVSVLATSGLDPSTAKVQPADDGRLDPLAKLMEQRVKDL